MSDRRRRRPRPGFSAPPETALLTAAELATWFQVSPRQLERIPGLPSVLLGAGAQGQRYLVRAVLAWLEAGGQVPSGPHPRRVA